MDRHRTEPGAPSAAEPPRGADALARAVERVAELERTLAEHQERARESLRALQESEERYRVLVDTCPDAITVTDLRGQVLLTNRQAATLQGYRSPEELRASVPDAFAAIVPEDRQRAYENAQRALETGAVRAIEYSLLTRDGGRVPVELNASLLRDATGAPQAFVGVVRDVTARQRAETERSELQARILQAQKLESLGMLAGGIAHDFNNLLVGMLGSASQALQELPAESPARTHLARIESAALRARELTGQLLAYAGKASFDVRPVDVPALVNDMAELLSLTISKNARLCFELAPELPAVESDPTQLWQVLMNLVTNASEALGDAPGAIVVRATTVDVDPGARPAADGQREVAPGTYLCLEVADSGCGMEPEVRAKLFDPFFSTKFAGRGLGLSAVLGIVRGHGGAIEVDTAPGQGSTVRVLLPASQRPPTARESREPCVESPPTPPVTLLLVDDEPAVLRVLEAILASAGYRVASADGGEQAVACFRAEPERFAAVVLDATMPDVDGAETSRRLRALRADTRILFSSGFAEQDVASRIALGPRDRFIQKPYRASELLAAVAAVVGSAARDGSADEPPRPAPPRTDP